MSLTQEKFQKNKKHVIDEGSYNFLTFFITRIYKLKTLTINKKIFNRINQFEIKLIDRLYIKQI
jgi:hypothetical protein